MKEKEIMLTLSDVRPDEPSNFTALSDTFKTYKRIWDSVTDPSSDCYLSRSEFWDVRCRYTSRKYNEKYLEKYSIGKRYMSLCICIKNHIGKIYLKKGILKEEANYMRLDEYSIEVLPFKRICKIRTIYGWRDFAINGSLLSKEFNGYTKISNVYNKNGKYGIGMICNVKE